MGYITYRAEKAAVDGFGEFFAFGVCAAVVVLIFAWPIIFLHGATAIIVQSIWTVAEVTIIGATIRWWWRQRRLARFEQNVSFLMKFYGESREEVLSVLQTFAEKNKTSRATAAKQLKKYAMKKHKAKTRTLAQQYEKSSLGRVR